MAKNEVLEEAIKDFDDARMVSLSEFAKLISVSESVLRAKSASGEKLMGVNLPVKYGEKGFFRFKYSDVVEFVESLSEVSR